MDDNESGKEGESSTQSCRCYVFNFGNFQINLIDTPGIGDTRGVEKDGVNMRNLLNFISNYKEINAICVLLKPNNARADVMFKYCILELLTHLNKSASENIVFIYTNSRGTFYRPGDTATTLKSILETMKLKPPYVNIKYSKENIFCVDNEAFRFLVADANGIQFNDDERNEFEKSWNNSLNVCRKMLAYINQLTPHQVQDTISINNARQTIINLTKPLGDTAKLIADNKRECEKRKNKINEFQGDINEFKKELYIPNVDIETEKLDQPMTVCGDLSCCETINVKGTSKTHYKTICHNPCYLKSTDGNVIGDSGLLDCKAFNKYVKIKDAEWGILSDEEKYPDHKYETNEKGEVFARTSKRIPSDVCLICDHSYQSHLHILYKTIEINTKIRDEAKHKQITSREEMLKAQQEQVKELENRIKQIENEQKIIIECTSTFAYFLKYNAIAPINDAFENYMKHLISLQTSYRTIESMRKMLENHQIEKEILQKAINKSGNQICKISKEEVNNLLNKLLKLEISGPMIKKCLVANEESQKSIHSVYNEVKFVSNANSKSLKNTIKKWFNFH